MSDPRSLGSTDAWVPTPLAVAPTFSISRLPGGLFSYTFRDAPVSGTRLISVRFGGYRPLTVTQ